MKIINLLLLMCLVSCKAKVSYRQIMFKEQAFLLSIPSHMREGTVRTIGNDLELIRTYYLPDSSCFIMLELSKRREKNIDELLEIEKIKLPFNYINSVLISTYVNNAADIKYSGIEYKSDESGDNINSIANYSNDSFIIRISIRFLRSYNGILGKNRDVIERVTKSLRGMK